MELQQRVVAIDCETTGFGRHDRIVEFAAVEVDVGTGQVVDEIDTLVNPERDVGPVDVHGVTASMVSAAPTFEEVAGALGRRLQGALLVAHNLAFDARLLGQEFQRLGTAFDPGAGYCTLRATSQKLGLACESFGIAHADQHRALSDARATAQLASLLLDDDPLPANGTETCRIGYIEQGSRPRTLRRPGGTANTNDMVRIVSRAHYPFSDEALLSYLDLLDWVLDDHVVTAAERRELIETAQDLGINQRQIEQAHRAYFDSIVAAAQRDHVITPDEHELMQRIAHALDIADATIPEITEVQRSVDLAEGTRVCFTGTATIGSEAVGREVLERLAALAGLVPVSSVTKKNCDLLVAADTSSSSGKARKARDYGIPVLSVADFAEQLG